MRALAITAFLLMVVSASAHAQPVTLWQNLTVGMPKAEVKQLYPTGKFSLTPECEVNVNGTYSSGRLVGVYLKFGDFIDTGRSKRERGMACQAMVRASLVSRYGDPSETLRPVDHRNMPTGEKLIWSQEPIMIEFFAKDSHPLTLVKYYYGPALAADKL